MDTAVPPTPSPARARRRWEVRRPRAAAADSADFRSGWQRDRDRILYSPNLRRLAEVTQVVSANRGYVFHNRLTHSLEVAQIARRLAERLTSTKHPDWELAETVGGIDPDVAEAAALSHDLGHPPYGHVGEITLNDLVTEAGEPDGFEGNAQSFRIVTRLDVQRPLVPQGLNLTRATLNGAQKYPWLRANAPAGMANKWGAYDSDRNYFLWVRQGEAYDDRRRCTEAEIVDWADDVAYSVHDVEDFYRAGQIPFDRLLGNHSGERDIFLGRVSRRDGTGGGLDEFTNAVLSDAFSALLDLLASFAPSLQRPFEDSHVQRVHLNQLKSVLITRYVSRIRVHQEWREPTGYLRIPLRRRAEVAMLKQLVWIYVINNPDLAAEQEGQQKILRRLFEVYLEFATNKRRWPRLPSRYREQLEGLSNADGGGQTPARVVADLIASMTEQQAATNYARMMGAYGS
jgi:dGTPase